MDESLSNWTIREAVKEFCFETRIEDINNCEHYFRPQQLVHFGYPNLGGASSTGEETPFHPHTSEELHHALEAAWANALLDLKTRIERGDLNVSGFQTQPDLRENRQQIPNQWAMDFQIDPLRSVVTLWDRRYVNVLLGPCTAVDNPGPPPPPATQPLSMGLRSVCPEDFPDLDDETVLALLEEHGRRVVKNGGRLMQPSRISFLPILLKKMQARAEAGELRPSCKQEVDWLAAWIKQRVEHHQVPRASGIYRGLREQYKELKTGIHVGD